MCGGRIERCLRHGGLELSASPRLNSDLMTGLEQRDIERRLVGRGKHLLREMRPDFPFLARKSVGSHGRSHERGKSKGNNGFHGNLQVRGVNLGLLMPESS